MALNSGKVTLYTQQTYVGVGLRVRAVTDRTAECTKLVDLK